MKQSSFSLLSILLIITISISLSCTSSIQETATNEQKENQVSISTEEIRDAQKTWGEGIVSIGEIYSEGGDYTTAASDHIDQLYGYQMGEVLFKPTLAAHKQFRTSREGALSYFVAGDTNYVEDHGFAIKPWSQVRWESAGTKIIGNMAIAMGNYYFTPAEGGKEIKVEYTFAYTKDEEGQLRIIMHGSHLPYTPPDGKNH